MYEILKLLKNREIVDQLLVSYIYMGCNITLKIYFLNSHLNFFREIVDELDLVTFSDELDERFIKTSQLWKKVTKQNVLQIGLLIIAGL